MRYGNHKIGYKLGSLGAKKLLKKEFAPNPHNQCGYGKKTCRYVQTLANRADLRANFWKYKI